MLGTHCVVTRAFPCRVIARMAPAEVFVLQARWHSLHTLACGHTVAGALVFLALGFCCFALGAEALALTPTEPVAPSATCVTVALTGFPRKN